MRDTGTLLLMGALLVIASVRLLLVLRELNRVPPTDPSQIFDLCRRSERICGLWLFAVAGFVAALGVVVAAIPVALLGVGCLWWRVLHVLDPFERERRRSGL